MLSCLVSLKLIISRGDGTCRDHDRAYLQMLTRPPLSAVCARAGELGTEVDHASPLLITP